MGRIRLFEKTFLANIYIGHFKIAKEETPTLTHVLTHPCFLWCNQSDRRKILEFARTSWRKDLTIGPNCNIKLLVHNSRTFMGRVILVKTLVLKHVFGEAILDVCFDEILFLPKAQCKPHADKTVSRLACSSCYTRNIARLILGLCRANERRRYKVTPFIIGWAQT